MHGEMKNGDKILAVKPESKSPLRRPRHRWKDNMQWILGKKDWGVWIINLAQDRGQWWAAMNTVVNLQVPCKAGNFLTHCAYY
jgi:hypothetical protein